MGPPGDGAKKKKAAAPKMSPAEAAAARAAALIKAAEKRALTLGAGGIQCPVKRDEQGAPMGFDFDEKLTLRGVKPGTPADQAGLGRFVGMRLRSVNGEPVGRLADCARFMSSKVLNLGLVPRPGMRPQEEKPAEAPTIPKKKPEPLPTARGMDMSELDRLRKENERLLSELMRAERDAELNEAPHEAEPEPEPMEPGDDMDMMGGGGDVSGADSDSDISSDSDSSSSLDSESDDSTDGSDSSSSSSDSDAGDVARQMILSSGGGGMPGGGAVVPAGHVVVSAEQVVPVEGQPGQVMVKSTALVSAAKAQEGSGSAGALVPFEGQTAKKGPAPPMLKPVQGRQMQQVGLTSGAGGPGGAGGQTAMPGMAGALMATPTAGSVVPAQILGQMGQLAKEIGKVGAPALKQALQAAAANVMPGCSMPQMTDEERLSVIEMFNEKFPVSVGVQEEMRQLDVIGLRIATSAIPPELHGPFDTEFDTIVMARISKYKEEGPPEGNEFGQLDLKRMQPIVEEGKNQYQTGGKVGPDGRLGGQRVSEDDWRVLPAAASRPKDDGQMRPTSLNCTLIEAEAEPEPLFGSCHCGDELISFQAEKTWLCSKCPKKFAKGSWFFGCDKCDYDLCRGCGVKEDMKQAMAAATYTIAVHSLLALGTWKWKPAAPGSANKMIIDSDSDDDEDSDKKRKREENEDEATKRRRMLQEMKKKLAAMQSEIREKEDMIMDKDDMVADAQVSLEKAKKQHTEKMHIKEQRRKERERKQREHEEREKERQRKREKEKEREREKQERREKERQREREKEEERQREKEREYERQRQREREREEERRREQEREDREREERRRREDREARKAEERRREREQEDRGRERQREKERKEKERERERRDEEREREKRKEREEWDKREREWADYEKKKSKARAEKDDKERERKERKERERADKEKEKAAKKEEKKEKRKDRKEKDVRDVRDRRRGRSPSPIPDLLQQAEMGRQEEQRLRDTLERALAMGKR